MAQDVLVLDENSFMRIVDDLSKMMPALQAHYDKAVKDIAALSDEWNDEDHQQLLGALKSLAGEINSISATNGQLVATAKKKIEMIQARRNIEM